MVLPDTIQCEGIPTSAMITLCSPYTLFGHQRFSGERQHFITLSLYQSILIQTILIFYLICDHLF
jgi:hypothetical protein